MIEEAVKRFNGVTLHSVYKDYINYWYENTLRYAYIDDAHLESYVIDAALDSRICLSRPKPDQKLDTDDYIRGKTPSDDESKNNVQNVYEFDDFNERVMRALVKALVENKQINLVIDVVKKGHNIEYVRSFEIP